MNTNGKGGYCLNAVRDCVNERLKRAGFSSSSDDENDYEKEPEPTSPPSSSLLLLTRVYG